MLEPSELGPLCHIGDNINGRNGRYGIVVLMLVMASVVSSLTLDVLAHPLIQPRVAYKVAVYP
jgi:hypothetical protein